MIILKCQGSDCLGIGMSFIFDKYFGMGKIEIQTKIKEIQSENQINNFGFFNFFNDFQNL
jgi:hypothetical protein